MADSLTDEQLLKDGRANLLIIVSKLLEKQHAKFNSADDSISRYVLQLDSMNNNAGKPPLIGGGDMKKMTFWSSEMGVELVHKSLERLGSWIIDEDASCKAVVCHGHGS
ncbi:hypothetical protein Dimus_011815 [Dionaea muscipula]